MNNLNASCVSRDSDGDKIFKIIIGGRQYSFNVNYLPDENDVWFSEVVGKHMIEIHNHAVETTKREVQLNIRQALGI